MPREGFWNRIHEAQGRYTARTVEEAAERFEQIQQRFWQQYYESHPPDAIPTQEEARVLRNELLEEYARDRSPQFPRPPFDNVAASRERYFRFQHELGRINHPEPTETMPTPTVVPNPQIELLPQERIRGRMGRVSPTAITAEEGTVVLPTPEFCANVAAFGVLQPIIVVESDRDGVNAQPIHYRIIEGRRRVEAARRAGATSIPAMILPLGTPTRTAAAIAVSTNLLRAPNLLSDAAAVAAMMRGGATEQMVADRLGLSIADVRARARLLSLIPALREVVAMNAIAYTTAVAISDWPIEIQQRVATAPRGRAGRITRTIALRVAREANFQPPLPLPMEERASADFTGTLRMRLRDPEGFIRAIDLHERRGLAEALRVEGSAEYAARMINSNRSAFIAQLDPQAQGSLANHYRQIMFHEIRDNPAHWFAMLTTLPRQALFEYVRTLVGGTTLEPVPVGGHPARNINAGPNDDPTEAQQAPVITMRDNGRTLEIAEIEFEAVDTITRTERRALEAAIEAANRPTRIEYRDREVIREITPEVAAARAVQDGDEAWHVVVEHLSAAQRATPASPDDTTGQFVQTLDGSLRLAQRILNAENAPVLTGAELAAVVATPTPGLTTAEQLLREQAAQITTRRQRPRRPRDV